MDMDVTLQVISLDKESVSRMISDICATDCDDGVSFAFENDFTALLNCTVTRSTGIAYL